MTTTEQSYATSPQLTDTLKRYSSIAAFLGLVFLGLLIAGNFMGGGFAGAAGGKWEASQFLRSYLFGFWLWFGAGAACLLITMTQYLTGGAWGVMIRRTAEAGAKTLYLFAFLFLPLLIWKEHIYWWTTPEGLADKVIHAKRLYLNGGFLWLGWAIYAAFLMGLTKILTGWSKQEDETKSTAISNKLEFLSGPSVLAFFLLMTLCAVDYLMTLEPYWYSTVYGFMIIIGWCLTALSTIIATMVLCARFEPFDHALTTKHLHDLGKILLALVMLWAYLNFAQLLITWSGNLPTETVWYIKRWNGGWGWVGLVLLFGHFIFPFLILLSQSIKKNPKTMSAVAIYIILVHAIDVFSLVEPNFQKWEAPKFALSWLDIVSPIGFGGLWFALFFRNLTAMPLLPLGAPDLKKALNHGRDH